VTRNRLSRRPKPCRRKACQPKLRRLKPRTTLRFVFPDLPKTLFEKRRKRRAPAALAASLPENYTPNGSFPLFVYVEGGCGASVTRKDLAYARKLAGPRDFIAVALPLFKKDLDPEEAHHGLLIQAHDDYPLISRCYRTMLRKLFATVPNIAHEHSCLGGFSNGAHTTALLLSAVDPFALRHFTGFYFLDGGFHITSFHKTAVRGKRFLYMPGGRRKKKDRRLLLDSLAARCARAVRTGVNVTLHPMPNTEHAFPDRHIPDLQAWVRAILCTSATQSGTMHP